MKYIVSYDISKDYIRKEISNFLISNNFIRIQKSVFLGEIKTDLLLEKLSILNSFLSDKSDTILISPICFQDLTKSYFLGKTFDTSTFEQFKTFIIF